MTFKKPLVLSALASLFALPLLTGCVYEDHDRYGRRWDHDRWDRHDRWDARPAGYRDRDRDGVPDRLEHRHW